jgi:HK97 family phage major capsid protein
MFGMTFYRTATFDVATGTASFSSEKPVLLMDKEGPYWEILDHGPGNAKLGLLNRSGVVLLNHDGNEVIGDVVKGSAQVHGDRKCRCTIELYPENRHLLDAVRSGNIPNSFSVGYHRTAILRKSVGRDGIRVIRFSFEPYEVSVLKGLEPADDGVGLNRSKQRITMNTEDETETENLENQPGNRHERRALAARTRDIRAAADMLASDFPEGAEHFRTLSTKLILEGKEPHEANRLLLDASTGYRKKNHMMAVSDEDIGLSRRDLVGNDAFLLENLQSIIRTGHPTRQAQEESDAYQKRTGLSFEGQFQMVPDRLKAWTSGRRDMNVSTFGQGGAFVQSTVMTPVIELLRNRQVTQRLGITVMGGLRGNCLLPRQTGAATAYSLPETAILTTSNQEIDQIALNPKRVGATNDYSKQLLLQSSIDVENFMRDDLMKVVAIKWDHLILEGQGSGSEPEGILNTIGVGSVAFGGAASWASVLAFETSLAKANADVGPLAWVVSPSTRARWKNIAKIGTTFPVYLWNSEDEFDDGSGDGRVNSYRAAVTNQVSNDTVYFGRFSDIVHALWGGLDFVVDIYTLARSAQVRITVNTFGDVALRHAASFAVSADGGAQ